MLNIRSELGAARCIVEGERSEASEPGQGGGEHVGAKRADWVGARVDGHVAQLVVELDALEEREQAVGLQSASAYTEIRELRGGGGEVKERSEVGVGDAVAAERQPAQRRRAAAVIERRRNAAHRTRRAVQIELLQ